MPSLINELMLGEVGTSLAGAIALIMIDSSKLKSAETLKFRKDLRGVGARLKVAKSAILYRVLPAEIAKVVPQKGSIGVVVCAGDISAAAKLVNELAKEEKVIVRGALLEGRALDAKSAAKLSDMPTREQASAMVIRVLNAPLVQLVRIANVKPTELVRIIKVKSEETASA